MKDSPIKIKVRGKGGRKMQLRILWEELLQRFDRIEVVGDPERIPSSFIRGYANLPVVLHAKK